MELQLKHIAAYLPYEIKIIFDDSTEVFCINFDEDIDYTNHSYPLSTLVHIINRQHLKSMCFKMILHPLSDYFRKTCKQVMDELNCSLDVVHEIWELTDGRKKLDQISVKTYSVMCENHIDFNRLIEAGLAVDINTIEPCTT